VLVDAISSLIQGLHRLGSARKRRAFAEAAQWVNTRGTGSPFSFDSICDALGIDPAILADRLSALTMGHGSRQPRAGAAAAQGIEPRATYNGESCTAATTASMNMSLIQAFRNMSM
jgi:hypothetical protein